ncbi:MAG: NAD(P)H-hydrate dehydratase [Hyphomicrobiaceae bacterium]|nr:NAD(P)H-hydrate dehydratase [Hyphomicrobiaceae bacterium]
MTTLLTTEEMGRADKAAVPAGVPSLTLMENAGRAVAEAAWRHVQKGDRVAVLCGPGNNGGDGFVAARLLAERGCDVVVGLLGDAGDVKGDATEMLRQWTGRVKPLAPGQIQSARVVIDAIFGAGLSRDVDGTVADVIAALNERAGNTVVISVDVPSGLDGNTGWPRDAAVQADETITFMCLKPGHVLYPGRALCGTIAVADIGIPHHVIAAVGSTAVAQGNDSASRFARLYPWRQATAHKYRHGHTAVVSGPALKSGAARMAARAALRIGSGLVTIAAPTSALPENAAHLTAVMLKPCGSARALADLLSDTRMNALLIGPGAGIGVDTAEMVLAALASNAAVVLDADALTSFAATDDGSQTSAGVGFGFTSKPVPQSHTPAALFAEVQNKPERPVVLTPHDGEFKRLFPGLAEMPSKIERARAAARQSGAVVILKGADSVIAAPDGNAAVNTSAPPWLATAGSGDVLAGFVAGLLAQRMSGFDAASMAVWLHGECANLLGPGLIAEDLAEALPQVLRGLRGHIG